MAQIADCKKARGLLFRLTFCLTMTGILALTPTRDLLCAQKPTITSATWNSTKERLQVVGKYWGSGQLVQVRSATSGDLLGKVRADAQGTWTLSVKNPAWIPCSVLAVAGHKTADRRVKGAPFYCDRNPFSRVFAFNDLGMHCYDSDFSVFSILPPYNVLHAQIVRRGAAGVQPAILDNTQATATYRAVKDRRGSKNTTSANKTNFWDYVLTLFGVPLPVDKGLMGQKMPGANNTARRLKAFDAQAQWFTAPGIPITNWDDKGERNTYPLMRVRSEANSASGSQLKTYAVLPVSDEMHCSACHATEGAAANDATKNRYGISGWSQNSDPEIQYRENVLILHDAKNYTDMINDQPVLCASCHYSPALDLAGQGPQGDQVGKPLLSHAIHSRHGKTVGGAIPNGSPAVIPDIGIGTCYYCHPGSITQCLRGTMGRAGLVCQDCHGGLLAVGGEYNLNGNGTRTPWVNEPKCQSCHTGDAIDHLGNAIRLKMAYDPADPAATPTTATNKRFAEENNTLYRNSLGHGGMACEACHGSPHAEWPAAGGTKANDNVAALQLQGHTGPILECSTCHGDGPGLTTNGPHGLHNVNDSRWNRNHSDFYENNPNSCKVCHGKNLRGTVLSRAAAYRVLAGDDSKVVKVAKGNKIGCTLCHENPLNGDN